jgi:hypothetical protein
MAKQKFRDPRGAHVRVYCSLLDSPAWKALSFSQRALYLACRRKLTSNNNGNLCFSLASLRGQGFSSSSTLATGLRALQVVGFIAVTRVGGCVSRGQTIPVLYRFTDEDCHEWQKLDIPSRRASNEWQRFSSTEVAQDAIQKATLDAKAAYRTRHPEHDEPTKQGKREKSSTLNSNCDDSKSEHATTRNSKKEAGSAFENRVDSKPRNRKQTQSDKGVA